MALLTVDEARAKILGLVEPGVPRSVAIEDAAGLCPTTDIRAPHPLPRFDNSSMDGYAVKRADLRSDSSIRLKLIGEIRAGDAAELPLGDGEAFRIMTGAPVPPGSDAIVPIELAAENGHGVEIRSVPDQTFIRPAGEDVREGEVVVDAGTVLGPAELALLASVGASPLEVRPAPRVACVTSGDELVAPDASPAPGQIRDSNSIALASLVRAAGGIVVPVARVGDDLDAVAAALKTAAAQSDLVVSAGGVSVGRHDYVREVLDRDGAVSLWRVAMQPGKPVLAGRLDATPFIGLPGNPVSVHVGFEQFVRPALRKMLGCAALLRPVAIATLTERIEKPAGRLHFVRVRLAFGDEGLRATPTGPQGSHIQTSLVGCDGVVLFDADSTEIEAGAPVRVEVWRLPDR